MLQFAVWPYDQGKKFKNKQDAPFCPHKNSDLSNRKKKSETNKILLNWPAFQNDKSWRRTFITRYCLSRNTLLSQVLKKMLLCWKHLWKHRWQLYVIVLFATLPKPASQVCSKSLLNSLTKAQKFKNKYKGKPTILTGLNYRSSPFVDGSQKHKKARLSFIDLNYSKPRMIINVKIEFRGVFKFWRKSFVNHRVKSTRFCSTKFHWKKKTSGSQHGLAQIVWDTVFKKITINL